MTNDPSRIDISRNPTDRSLDALNGGDRKAAAEWMQPGYSNWIESMICWISCAGPGPAPL